MLSSSKKMFSKIVLLSALILCLSGYVKSDEAVIQDCGSVTGKIVKISMVGCENQSKCPLKRGSYANLTATFTSNTNSNNLKAVVTGKIGIIKQRFILPNPDACQSGVNCPIKPDQTYTYSVSIFVKTSYPRLSVDVQLELKDDEGKDVICADIPARIVSNKYLN